MHCFNVSEGKKKKGLLLHQELQIKHVCAKEFFSKRTVFNYTGTPRFFFFFLLNPACEQ